MESVACQAGFCPVWLVLGTGDGHAGRKQMRGFFAALKDGAKQAAKAKAEADPPRGCRQKATAKSKGNCKGNGKGNGKDEMRGFLRCATDGETVRRFGRNDDSF